MILSPFPMTSQRGLASCHTKKNPDVFELIRGKCNKLQALPNELAMMGTNLPSGYHREMQLFKGPIIQAIDEIKSCLSMTTSSIAEVQVKSDILSDDANDEQIVYGRTSVEELEVELRQKYITILKSIYWEFYEEG